MFLHRLGAVVLGFAVAQPLMAVEGAGPAAFTPETFGAVDSVPAGADHAAISRVAQQSHGTPLVRLLAFSSARLTAARQAAQAGTALLPHPLAVPSLLEQLPMVNAMKRRVGERWNTTDSSRPSDFALCYRFSRVMGLQVIPGDLSPAKLPTPKMLSVKNQGSGMGVLVGMTFRIGH